MSGRWSGSTRRASLPPDWEQRRESRRLIAGGRCECPGSCGNHAGRCTSPGSECDHHNDDPRDHAITNLRWICAACHALKTAAKAQRARDEERQRQRHPSTRARHPGLT